MRGARLQRGAHIAASGRSGRRLRLRALLFAALALACLLAMPPAAFAQVELSVDADVADDSDAGWGLQAFHRAKRGSVAPLPDGRDVGYRYITGAADSIVLIATRDAAVLYVPPSVCDELGVDVADQGHCQSVLALVEALDRPSAEGGMPLGDLGLQVAVTSEPLASAGGFSFEFGIECEGRTYAAVSGGDPSKNIAREALFCDYGQLTSSEGMSVVTQRSLAERVVLFFRRLDWNPLLVSLRTVIAATLLAVAVGLSAGRAVLHAGERAKSVFDVVFMLPMILPPPALGIILVYVFGKFSPSGRWLMNLGVNVPFTWAAAVISSFVVAIPFMYRAARGAFEGVDANLLDAARTLGWSEPRVFARLMLPLCAPELVAGSVLSFSRAFGEFGATMIFAGDYAGVTETIPLAIYYDWMAGDVAAAGFWVAVTIASVFAFTYATRSLSRRRGRSG